MTREEFALFEKLSATTNTVIEYGSGGSTIFFLRNRKKVFSVDSNPDFHRLMMAIPFVSRAIGTRLNLDFVDVGPTDTWGTPLSTDRAAEWPSYVSQPWSRVEHAGARVDMVLVDGRFRVACCLYSVRKLLEEQWPDTLIVMHDFWDRPEYHVVLPFVQEQGRAGTLAAFHPKPDADLSALERLFEEYSSIPR